ncbi:single-stranded-DNA-specific exonuclease RecJ [Adlercreutzia sp. ZJ141]|uniref:single-stranded-DNA-specific exonuclease RecJ n=1 Tax=Adlercreutzia sp. ZJ141 TaxID=2709406 RepID=UPI0013EC92F4|nr:single-stranded-DNA-specific exonuclease RecJ [Adlercreutzia sp. ZJ141]
MSVQFSIKSADSAVVQLIHRELGIPRFVARVMASRGIRTVEDAKRFLTPSLGRDWLDPYSIPGLAAVADALESAMRAGERILVFGDFDLDGISATTVLTRGLRCLGADAVPFIPRRFEEGYGLSQASIMRACSFGPDFIVTVDCGISCKEEAAMIVDAGLKFAVTDHHEPSESVPVGVPVADPKIGDDCPSAILAGVGVALKLVQVLGARFGQPHLWREFTDFATLGTVADLMPMRDENRALVADGLARMNAHPRPCIAALLETSGAAGKQVTSTNMSFSVVPRLNAAGRMGDAQLALDLLMTDDFEEAHRLAERLEAVNDQRRAIEAELSEIAKAEAEKTYHGQRALVVAGEGWHEGVKGIVASRLSKAYGVPCLLFTIEDGEARGSGRSVGTVNLFKAVESVSDLCIRFGGHEAAVGVTLPADVLPEFERRLCAYMDALPADDFHPLVEIDARVELDELTLEGAQQLNMLAPFGQERKSPVFLASNVTLSNCRAVGAEKNHFSCTLSDGRGTVSGIMFHCSNIDTLMHTDSVVNAAFEVQIDEWRGRRSVKAMLQSLSPARACAALEACLDPDNLNFVADLYAMSDVDLCTDHQHTPEEVEAYESAQERRRAIWRRTADADPQGLERAVVHAIIGDAKLHPAQRRILDHLGQNVSTLAVMATGRGKSLTFQVHAATRALRDGEASLFVYPLRALIADQAFHLRASLESFGVGVATLTGESTPEERRRSFDGLADGSIDVVLTTPEFLAWHADEFAAARRIRFVVVDEAHHIALARAGQRSAYANLGSSVAKLGDVVVLALTATADDVAEAAIMRELPIKERVFDFSDRPNLRVVDKRNCRNRDDYLANLIAQGQKTLIFVNSRERSVAVARALRRRVPQLAPMIGFYNAGLSRLERKRIEDLFRTGSLSVLVATSAFGEGVNIADIRHVALYHLPFNEIEFNQMSGRAGRDGKPAFVHLLFSRQDCSINERILHDMTPDHDCMAQVYRRLRAMQRECGAGSFAVGNADLAAAASTDAFPVSAAAAACGVAVFRELGLIETHTTHVADGVAHAIRVIDTKNKVELTDSIRYREGLDEREVFHAFRDWVMRSDRDAVHGRISRPIMPNDARSFDDDENSGGCKTPGALR